jgi:hypothetical protein
MRSRNPSMADRTFVSKYGAFTGPEYFRRRFNEQLENWLSPAALHYVFTRIPAVDDYGRPIVHSDFEYLDRVNPEAAANQLIAEARAFFDGLPERDRRRAAYVKQQRIENQAAVAAHVRRRRNTKPHTPPIPGM